MSVPQIEARLFVEARHLLGEGPVWFADRLWWVDIEPGMLHSVDGDGGTPWNHSFGQRISAFAPLSADHLIVALQDGVGIFDRGTKQVKLVAFPDGDVPGNRCNDGKLDPAGRFVVGTLNMNGQPGLASLYSLEAPGILTKRLSGVHLSNGLAWGGDGSILYFIDSKTHQIAAFDYDLSTGELSNRRVVVNVPPEMGLPDGMDIDIRGNLWVGHWGGNAVRCWSPESGQCLAEVPVPCPQPTSCCFGGPKRDQLFITTARIGLSDAELDEFPLSGSIFTCDPAVCAPSQFPPKNNII